jgi:hypothetical protein
VLKRSLRIGFKAAQSGFQHSRPADQAVEQRKAAYWSTAMTNKVIETRIVTTAAKTIQSCVTETIA